METHRVARVKKHRSKIITKLARIWFRNFGPRLFGLGVHPLEANVGFEGVATYTAFAGATASQRGSAGTVPHGKPRALAPPRSILTVVNCH